MVEVFPTVVVQRTLFKEPWLLLHAQPITTTEQDYWVIDLLSYFL